MKKLVSIVLLLVMSMSVVLLVACDVDFVDAEAVLENNDYVVVVSDSVSNGLTDGSITNLIAMKESADGYCMVVVIEFSSQYALDTALEAVEEEYMAQQGYIVVTRGLFLIYGDELSVDLVL